LSVHQILVGEGVLSFLLWCFKELWGLLIHVLVEVWGKLLALWWVEAGKAWLLESSPVDKWLKLSVLSLHNLGHGLVEEVLSGVSSASAL
jgi:hypothetical protein